MHEKYLFILSWVVVNNFSSCTCALDLFNVTERLLGSIYDKIATHEVDEKIITQMFQISGKNVHEFLTGNLNIFGNFDECYNNVQGVAGKYGKFQGKYCLGNVGPFEKVESQINLVTGRNISLKAEPVMREEYMSHLAYRLGVCIPDFLSAREISESQSGELFISFSEDFCYSRTKQAPISQEAFMTITVLSIFASLAAISTLYDLVLHYVQKETPSKLLVAFSLLSNGRRLFLQKNYNPDHLLCINGIRALSMVWVLYAHVHELSLGAPFSNIYDILQMTGDFTVMLVFGASLAVDTFLTITGTVTVYVFLQNHVDNTFDLFRYYLHRVFRLTPALAVIILVYRNLVLYAGSGPLWGLVGALLVEPCRNHWWATLLYFGNYVQMCNCISQAWYLSVDMQLFLLTPFILIPLKKWTRITLVCMGILILLGISTPFMIFYENVLPFGTVEYIFNYYILTHARFGPYVIGMLLGYAIYKSKTGKYKTSKGLVVLLCTASFAVLLACIFSGHTLILAADYDKLQNALYAAFNKNAWSAAVCILIFFCVSGDLGSINKLLSTAPLQVLSKLSYSMYLVHFAVITVDIFSRKRAFQMTSWSLLYDFCGDFAVTFVLSIVLYLLFEAPIAEVEKFFSHKSKDTTRV